ncbi:MAG: DivIVA domain-containing protein [Balneolaceae bacterium]|nr:DivIVA domain-containing protein [Balneolaceae bacterium]
MKLTALEIKQQKFEKAFRGYDPDEVQAFLNLVSNEFEHLVAKNRELEEKIEEMEEKLKHYEKVEAALHDTLQTAKESAEQKMSGARKEARNTVEKAEMQADSIIREAIQQRQQIRQSIMRLLNRRKEIISGMRSYLDMAKESLEQFSKDEAKLFTIPGIDSDSPSADIDEEVEKNKQKIMNNSIEEEEPKESYPPGAENVDDILDQLD